MPMMEELLRKGSGPGPHKHTWSDETFYMLDGEITADEIKPARTGDCVIPPMNASGIIRMTLERLSR